MNKESPPIRKNGDYHHRAMVNHKFARGGKPAGLGNTLAPDIEHAAAKYGLAFENAGPFCRLGLGRHFAAGSCGLACGAAQIRSSS